MTMLGMLALATTDATHSQDVPLRPPGLPSLPGSGASKTAEQLVRVRSSADVDVATPGQTFHLAFVFEIEKDWHIYWKNSGASGGPTTIAISAPSDFTIGTVRYPRPKAFHSEEGTTYGYEGTTVIYVEVTAPPVLASGHVSFNARVNWMVCKDICLTGRAVQIINVVTAERDAGLRLPSARPQDPAIAANKSHLPKNITALTGGKVEHTDTTLTMTLPAAGFSTAEFFPDETPGVTYDSATVKREGEVITVTVPIAIRPNNAQGQPLRIAGTVGLGNRQTDPAYDIEIPLSAP